MKVAVIGIGSNSVRMLLAEKDQSAIRRLLRDREGTRLFAGLDEEGRLSSESMALTCSAVCRMVRHAREEGVDQPRVFATSASRDATNGEAFLRMLREKAGVEVEILSGREEAELSFYGASAVLNHVEPRGVVDIGGGSTELVIGGSQGIQRAVSCQMGAVRLFRRMPIASREQMIPVEQEAADILQKEFPLDPKDILPEAWVGTGGTFTTLSAIARKVPWTDRANMHGTAVTLTEILEIGRELADMPLEKRMTLPGLQPSRADIVVHGICILLAVMRHLGLEQIYVSEWGNLDGYILKRF